MDMREMECSPYVLIVAALRHPTARKVPENRKLERTLALSDLDLERYDAVHVAGGGGAEIDLFPNDDVGRVLDHFFDRGKVVGAICHGAIALANLPERARGRTATGFSRAEDAEVEAVLGKGFIPNFPQDAMEAAGIRYSSAGPHEVLVVVDGLLVTGQNQQSASEYGLALDHALVRACPASNV